MNIGVDDPELLQCEVGYDGTAGWVKLAGELDIGTVEPGDAALRKLRELGIAQVVLDLRELDFMDSTGIALVVRWSSMARHDGFVFGVVPGGEPIQRVFRMTGLETELTVVDPPYGA